MLKGEFMDECAKCEGFCADLMLEPDARKAIGWGDHIALNHSGSIVLTRMTNMLAAAFLVINKAREALGG